MTAHQFHLVVVNDPGYIFDAQLEQSGRGGFVNIDNNAQKSLWSRNGMPLIADHTHQIADLHLASFPAFPCAY